MPHFFPLAPPFCDVSVISCKDAAHASQVASRLVAPLRAQELLVHLNPGNPTCVAAYSRTGCVITRQEKSFLFSGFGRLGSEFLIGGRGATKIAAQDDRANMSGNLLRSPFRKKVSKRRRIC